MDYSAANRTSRAFIARAGGLKQSKERIRFTLNIRNSKGAALFKHYYSSSSDSITKGDKVLVRITLPYHEDPGNILKTKRIIIRLLKFPLDLNKFHLLESQPELLLSLGKEVRVIDIKESEKKLERWVVDRQNLNFYRVVFLKNLMVAKVS